VGAFPVPCADGAPAEASAHSLLKKCAKGHPHSRENGYAGQGMREAQPGITVFVEYPYGGAASEHAPREIRYRP
jgi:hypothetical protein